MSASSSRPPGDGPLILVIRVAVHAWAILTVVTTRSAEPVGDPALALHMAEAQGAGPLGAIVLGGLLVLGLLVDVTSRVRRWP